MSKSKNYNSIVFLTTLSVYLGLVLVGAPPAVLAQAALTQKIEIKNEAENKDDLDKKPDDDAIKLSGATGGYFDDLEDLIEDLQKLHQIEKFNLDFHSFHYKQSEIVECGLDGVRHSVGTSNIDQVHERWLVPAIIDARWRFENYAFLGDCQPKAELDKKKGVSFELEISYDKAAFKFGISVAKESPQKAKQLLDRFDQAYKIYELDDDEPIIRKIYENTSFKSENNQIFIVTRLPRASIDELLAKNAQ